MDRPSTGIAVRALSKRFGSEVALDGVDLDVPRGSVLGLLGPAGAGKSTAIRVLAGLARPSAGMVEIDRSRLGVLCQPPGAYGWMTGRELLGFVADLQGVEQPAQGERAEAILVQVGLAAAADRRIGTYDAEERQRLGLAQALVAQPDILLLDDPVAGLDEAGRHDLLEVIGTVRGAATVVVATRSIGDVEAACDHVAVLREGRVLVAGPVGAVLGRFAPAALELDVDPGAGLALSGLLARLRAEPWVRDVSSNGEGVRIMVSDEERSARELLPSIVATGLTIGTMRRVRPELDELLMRVDAAANEQAGARS